MHKLRGRLKYPNLVLKRGVTHEDALLEWFFEASDRAERGAVTVTLLGPRRARTCRHWAFAGAFPVKWHGPDRERRLERRRRPRRSRSPTRASCREGLTMAERSAQPDSQRATLEIEGDGTPIECWFNPKEYSITKTNKWKVEPVVGTALPTPQFGGGAARAS